MPRVCQVTGRRTRVGNKVSRRGLAKKAGGVGRRVTSRTKRTFKPNIQSVRVLLPDGTVQRMKLSTRAIKTGLVPFTEKGKTRLVPLVKAIRGRNRAYREEQALLAEQAGDGQSSNS
ncbi:MAG: 50S ribosomal protein L28 [Planctomycetota bacterium]|nr:MAG: 50S ribosomal protein L28 [Planctomycetota bacterium]